MTRNLVLIPSSRFVDQQMQLEVGTIPPVLIPVNGKPLFEAIIENFTSLPGQTTFLIMVNEGKEMVEEFLVRRDLEQEVSLLEVSGGKDLGTTISEALNRLALEQFDRLFLNFGDTLVEAEADLDSDSIFYDDLEESFRWTTFEEHSGKITRVTDKFVSEDIGPQHIFTGLFLIREPERFAQCLKNSNQQAELAPFYSGLLKYLADTDYKLVKVAKWHDFGHVDNFYQAKKKFVNKRYFNEIEIDEHKAILTKRSSNLAKFSGEIKWYLEFPSALKCYTPQIFDYSLSGDHQFIKMEYYGYPALSEMYLFGGHTPAIWNHVLDSIFGLLSEMRRFELNEPKARINQALLEMYLDKTRERLSFCAAHPVLAQYFENELTINGQSYQPVNYYLERLQPLCSRVLIDKLNSLSVIHGDLCLSNILFDPKSRILKIVDPRGRFGEHTIYGDFRYDLAKLSHSFNGHYESIINDGFFALCQGSEISYSLAISEKQQIVTNMFNKRLQAVYGPEVEAVELIEALLFLSMIPLHRDFLNRQIMMLAIGLPKLHQILERV